MKKTAVFQASSISGKGEIKETKQERLARPRRISGDQ